LERKKSNIEKKLYEEKLNIRVVKTRYCTGKGYTLEREKLLIGKGKMRERIHMNKIYLKRKKGK